MRVSTNSLYLNNVSNMLRQSKAHCTRFRSSFLPCARLIAHQMIRWPLRKFWIKPGQDRIDQFNQNAKAAESSLALSGTSLQVRWGCAAKSSPDGDSGQQHHADQRRPQDAEFRAGRLVQANARLRQHLGWQWQRRCLAAASARPSHYRTSAVPAQRWLPVPASCNTMAMPTVRK